MVTLDPTRTIDLDFAAWMRRRKRRQGSHLIGGIPDYAFSWDLRIRRQLEAVPPLRLLAQSITAAVVPVQRALHEASAVAVGPDQLPRLHGIGVDCAERLGIGVPQIFIVEHPVPNAFTFATNDVDQLVVVTGSLLELLDDDELRFVIGHECGHIHNRHVAYNTLWELLTNQLAMQILRSALRFLGPLGTLAEVALAGTSQLVFGRWHRCAEITCDRAGLICSPDPQAAQRVHAKLSMGHIGALDGFDPEEYQRQTRTYGTSWLRIMELLQTHPPGPMRTQAIQLYRKTDVFASWRPELRQERTVPQAEVDQQIEKLIY